MMKQETFELRPIGRIENQMVVVDEGFRKGLKFLSKFSHGILLYEDRENPNILNTGLRQKVVRLEQVEEMSGHLSCPDFTEPGKPVLLYDIKPYFPMEDRVNGAVGPAASDSPNPGMHTADSLTELGIIRKIQGHYYLEIPQRFDACINALAGFSHVKIFWWFHKFDKDIYRQTLECDPPYENAPRTGVFASRSPVRPNPIALSTARILEIDHAANRMKVSGLDCFDRTPLIGLCPYLPDDDCKAEVTVPEWLSHWPKWLDDRDFEVRETPEAGASAFEQLKSFTAPQTGQQSDKTGYFEQRHDTAATSAGIVIKGAAQNNLKHIDVTIPYGRITVITGISGSGKSSLAFDTIYAESQQRFLAGMSMAERSQLSLLERPKFDQITGLPPAIAISQQQVSRNPRSTVGTATDLTGLLRALFAGIGVRHCPECGRSIEKRTVQEIVDCLRACRAGTIQRIAPYQLPETEQTLVVPEPRDKAYGSYITELNRITTDALAAGSGAVQVRLNGGDSEQPPEPLTFQTTEYCHHCDHMLFELTPADFSYNHPESMCPVCLGLGSIADIDADRIVRYPERSLLDNASAYWKDLRKFRQAPNANWMKGEVLALALEMSVDLELPWQDLPADFRHQALYGTGEREVSYTYNNPGGRSGTITRPVRGAYHCLKQMLQAAGAERQAALQDEFLTTKPCNCCHGERLKTESRLVSVAGVRYPETLGMSMDELQGWIAQLPEQLSDPDAAVCRPLLQELYRRLTDYRDAGLGYLTLDRPAPTLSGGEYQRLQLVSQLSSEISNILYILDEPTAGLHPKDYDKLFGIIRKLKQQNNTVIIVEHARAVMDGADYIIDIGGGSGIHGGYLIAEGTPAQIRANPESETGQYLSGQKTLRRDGGTNSSGAEAWVQIAGIRGNNLKDVDIRFPTGTITCITGVSGSGKSSLINYGILPALGDWIDGRRPTRSFPHNTGCSYREITGSGTENIRRIIHIDQKPIGRSSRSSPATYTGIMDELRALFARTEQAAGLSFTPGHFSYNSKEGQCPVCHGYGYQSLDTTFMPAPKVTCRHCHGTKFRPETLKVVYEGKTIADVLDMSIRQARDFFQAHDKLHPILELLCRIGLGYLKLGQSSQTLSGGEAQRIKLATELHQRSDRPTLYLLDEPTTGLHFADIRNLLNILQTITEHGNTVILIEHNLDVIQNADWIIDLGPEGGTGGGEVLIQGTIEDLINCPQSHTGALLTAIIR